MSSRDELAAQNVEHFREIKGLTHVGVHFRGSFGGFGGGRIQSCNQANEDVLIELAGAPTCTPVDVASQNVLEVKP